MQPGCFMFAVLAVLCVAVSCSQSTSVDTSSQTPHEHQHDHHDHEGKPAGIESPVAPSEAGEQFILSEPPTDPQDVISAKASVEDQAEITLVGRIGGNLEPWIEGRAIFTVVDSSLQSCERIPGDNCPTPWDFCCRTDKIPAASALVKVVDESGQPIKSDARELLGVRELTEVIVSGKALRDDSGNLTVLASKVYVKK